MNLGKTLFSFKGTIRGRDYWVVCFGLLLIGVLIQVSSSLIIINSEGMQGLMIGDGGMMEDQMQNMQEIIEMSDDGETPDIVFSWMPA